MSEEDDRTSSEKRDVMKIQCTMSPESATIIRFRFVERPDPLHTLLSQYCSLTHTETVRTLVTIFFSSSPPSYFFAFLFPLDSRILYRFHNGNLGTRDPGQDLGTALNDRVHLHSSGYSCWKRFYIKSWVL